jgi:hypothetical protein
VEETSEYMDSWLRNKILCKDRRKCKDRGLTVTAVIWLGNRVKQKMTAIEESKRRHCRSGANLEIPAI